MFAKGLMLSSETLMSSDCFLLLGVFVRTTRTPVCWKLPCRECEPTSESSTSSGMSPPDVKALTMDQDVTASKGTPAGDTDEPNTSNGRHVDLCLNETLGIACKYPVN